MSDLFIRLKYCWRWRKQVTPWSAWRLTGHYIGWLRIREGL